MSEYSDLIGQYASVPQAQTVASADANPDDAAQAIQLGQATQTDPSIILGDLPGFQTQHKAMLASDIVAGNPDLQDYVRSHPLAAQVSNDDWGNLDAVSQSGGWLSRFKSAAGAYVSEERTEAQGAIEQGAQAQEQLVGGLHQVAGGDLASGLKNVGLGALTDVLATGSYVYSPIGAAVKQIVSHPIGQAISAATGSDRLGQSVEGAIDQTAAAYLPMGHAAEPFVANGFEAPAGIHPQIDQIKGAVNARGVQELESQLAAAQQSATRVRSPEMFRNFVAQQHGNTTIGISGDAVSALYGDKLPEAGDGLLGWAPGIADQLSLARETGADVHVPIADWLTNVDPQVAASLHDDIRVWPGGVTARELTLPPEPKEVVDSPLAQTRGAFGMEPMFAMGDRKLQLLRDAEMEGYNKAAIPESGGLYHEYQMLDDRGQQVGQLTLLPDPATKTLNVQMISGEAGRWANSFGPSLIRDLKRQLKALYPDYETISGHRVTGARDVAGTTELASATPKVALATPDISADDYHGFQNVLNDAYWHQISPGVMANIRPADMYLQHELELHQVVSDELHKMGGRGFHILPADQIRMEGMWANPEGLFQQYPNRPPLILYDLFADDALGVARHEGIHLLRRQGLLSDRDWKTLTDASQAEDWQGRYDIHRRYDGFTDDEKMEESIAEAYHDWAAGKDTEAAMRFGESPVTAIFRKMHEFWQGLKSRIGQILGHEPTWEDMFQGIKEGKYAAGDLPTDAQGRVALALPQDMEAVQAKAMGLDIESFRKLQRAVTERYEADLAAAQARAERDQRRAQTKEWKANAAEIRKDVEAQIRQRPDIAADQFLGSGELYGQKVGGRFTLRVEDLTDEQRASLPRHYVSESGLPVDDTARLFGYSSGDQMLARLAALHQGDLAGITARERIAKVIAAETDRQMQAKFGSLGENIMSEARDQALSETDLNLMAEELQATGMKAGTPTVDTEAVKEFAQESFGKQRLGDVNTQQLLTVVGRHGRDAERALIAQKPADAVVSLQRKYLSAVIAKEATKLDKERAGFNKLTKSMARKEIKTLDPEYHNWINDLMQRVGLRTQRMPWDVQREIEAYGKTLPEFAQERNDVYGRQLEVPEFLQDPAFRQDLSTLTVDQFRDLNNFMKSLVDNGRDERRVNVKGEAMDLAEYKDKVIQEIQNSRTVKEYQANGGRWKSPVASKLEALRAGRVAAHMNVVDLMDRFDHWDPNGLWSNGPIRDLVRGAQERDRMIKKYSKQLLDADDGADLRKAIDNTIFRAPEGFGGYVIRGFTRKNLRAIMLNLGTNLREMAEGYGLTPQQIIDWVNLHATHEDWIWVQKVWKVFREVKSEGDTMYRSIGSHGITETPAIKLQTPFGEVEGGYYPLVRHEVWGGLPKSVKDATLNADYVRYTPPAGYTKARTKAVYPLSLDADALPNRLMQEIHDISMRPGLIQGIKVFLDKDIQATISAHFGKEVGALLRPYIADLATTSNRMASVQAEAASLLGGIRQNLITSLVGVGTFAKHTPTAWVNSIREVGLARFHQELFNLLSRDTDTGETSWQFAMKNSNELPRRAFNAEETVYGAHQIVTNRSTFRSLQQTVKRISSEPLMLGDLASAVPLWNARYKMAIEAGETHGDAVYAADRAVQHAHGSTLITNRPAVVRNTNPWFTSLYNFYSNMVNRHMEAVWKAGERVGEAGSPYETHAQKVKDIAGMTFAYAVWPAIIEQMVSPIGTDQDSWTKKAAEAMAQQFASGWIGLRDVAGYLIRGEDPGFGLVGTGLKYGGQVVRDVATALQKGSNPTRDRAIINSGINSFGLMTGLVPAPLGNLAKYEAGVQLHQEHPRSAWDWMISAPMHGTSRPRPRR